VFDGGENGSSILFEDPYITFIYFKVIFSAVTVGLIISLIYFYAYNEKKYLYWSMILLTMKSIMLLSRNDIYRLAILFILIEIFFGKSKISASVTSNIIKQKRFYLSLILCVSIISISIVSYFRLTEADMRGSDFNFFTFYLQQFVDYHTQGLLLMNSQINDPNSFINNNITYGLASLGGLEEIIALVIRKFGIEYDTLAVYLSQYKDQTYSEISPGVYYSIYYTMFFEFYLDGREFFVFLVSSLLGYTTAYFYLDWIKNQSLDSLFYSLLLVNTLIMSIFQTEFTSSFWISLLLFFVLKKMFAYQPLPEP
jgi:oligosaccharide repeat unit polymerase